MHLRDHRWLRLIVGNGGRDDRASLDLAKRRAEAAVRMITDLGWSPDRIQVELDQNVEVTKFDHGTGPRGAMLPSGMEVPAWVTAMIPPEEVERLRIQRERHNIVVC